MISNVVAMFLPLSADELTIDEALQLAADRGLILCTPKSYSPERPFRAICFAPECIPSGYAPLRLVVKTPSHASLESPCVA